MTIIVISAQYFKLCLSLSIRHGYHCQGQTCHNPNYCPVLLLLSVIVIFVMTIIVKLQTCHDANVSYYPVYQIVSGIVILAMIIIVNCRLVTFPLYPIAQYLKISLLLS